MTSRYDWQFGGAPKPRKGDEFTVARTIINAARIDFAIPSTAAPLELTGAEDTQQRRRAIADWLAGEGVPVPGFVPIVYGWWDCYTGQLANPAHEPGANGRVFS